VIIQDRQSTTLDDSSLAAPWVDSQDIETDLEIEFIKSADAILGSFAPSWVSP
jgi:hypothetical protein